MSDVNRLTRPLVQSPAARPPARRERLAEGVVATLIDAIVSGRPGPGGVLPPEAALAETFAVSRSTIREAVKLLEAKGLVEVRQGVGTVVQPGDDWHLLEGDVLAATVRHETGLAVLDELVRVRAALESMLVVEAVAHADEHDLAEIGTLFDRMEREIESPRLFIETDAAFHERIMRASGSRLTRSIVKTVHDEARASELYAGQPTPEGCRTSNAEHRRVWDALRARDADGSAEALREHITQAWARRRP